MSAEELEKEWEEYQAARNTGPVDDTWVLVLRAKMRGKPPAVQLEIAKDALDRMLINVATFRAAFDSDS